MRRTKRNRIRYKLLTGIVSLAIAAGFAIPVSVRYGGEKSGSINIDIYDYENTLKVHFVDVGQGDCILIQQDNEAMLIDAGENYMGDTVTEYLSELGISELKYAVGTHPHSDHIGGMDEVIEKIKVEELLLPNMEYDSQTYKDVINAADTKDVLINYPSVGEQFEIGNASFIITAPNDTYKETNNMSLVIKLDYENISYMFMGDAEIESEYDMSENGIDIEADVLKTGHHGSDTSSSQMLLKKVKPEYAVISVGEGNSYGHPAENILERLKQFRTEYFRTDVSGTIISVTDGDEIVWETEK